MASGVFTLLELCRINEHQKVTLDLDPYVKKLLNARRRVVLVNNILQNAQVGFVLPLCCAAHPLVCGCAASDKRLKNGSTTQLLPLFRDCPRK